MAALISFESTNGNEVYLVGKHISDFTYDPDGDKTIVGLVGASDNYFSLKGDQTEKLKWFVMSLRE